MRRRDRRWRRPEPGCAIRTTPAMVVVKAAALIEGAGLRPVGGRSGRTVSGTWPVSLTQRSGRIGTIGIYEAGSRRGPGLGGQIDPRRPTGRDHPPASDRTGRALLAAGPSPHAAGRVGSHPASARRAGIVDHGRGPRILRCHRCPAARRGRHRVPGLLAVPLCLARHPPVARARRLLEVACCIAAAAVRYSGRRSPHTPTMPSSTSCRPARGPAIHREDSLRHA